MPPRDATLQRVRALPARLARWFGPPLTALGVLLAAGLAAWAVVRLVTLALVPTHSEGGSWSDSGGQAALGSGSQPRNAVEAGPEEVPELPEQAVERKRGLWTLGLAVGTLLVLVAGALVVQALIRDRRPADYFIQVPNADPRPGAELLQGYHWVDQSAGIVQIPIDQAMDLVVQRGLPARPAAEAQQFQDEGHSGPSDSSGGRMP